MYRKISLYEILCSDVSMRQINLNFALGMAFY